MVIQIKSTKGEKMGLDQYAGLRDSKGEVHEKFYWRNYVKKRSKRNNWRPE